MTTPDLEPEVRSEVPAALSRGARWARERLRRSYRPARVRLLFIGESPPASGRFFYQRDSGLYRAFFEAFRAVLPPLPEADFLAVFQAAGCYLIDACLDPVDHLEPRARRAACLAGEVQLARAIRTLQPAAAATIVRSIRGNLERAAARAGWQGPLLDLPYPGRWISHRKAFLEKLAPELRNLAPSLPSDSDRLTPQPGPHPPAEPRR